MGHCCRKTQSAAEETELKQTNRTVITQNTLKTHQSTRFDTQFTYFLGVFQLLALGEQLEQPEFIDELHPSFSYEKFNSTYRQYQKQILNLGQYLQQYDNPLSNLHTRLLRDQQKIHATRTLTQVNTSSGCLIKLELQEINWKKAKDIIISLQHPLQWPAKEDRHISIDTINKGGTFLEMPLPDTKGILKITSKGSKGEILFKIEECVLKEQLLFCKIFKWKGADSSEGLALRMQIVIEDPNKKRHKEMVDLHQKLTRDFGVGGQIQMSVSEADISNRLSRHRDSLSKKYNLKNSFL